MGANNATEDSDRYVGKRALDGPVTKESTPLIFPCSGVSLNLVPLTLERVNDRTLGVRKRLVHMRGLVTEDLRTFGGSLNVPTHNAPDKLPNWVSGHRPCICQLPRKAIHASPGAMGDEEDRILRRELEGQVISHLCVAPTKGSQGD